MLLSEPGAPADARRRFASGCSQPGLSVEIDAVGNVVGRLRVAGPAQRRCITGSHYDTVINAGRYDGRLGIVLPIVCALELRQTRASSCRSIWRSLPSPKRKACASNRRFSAAALWPAHFDPALLGQHRCRRHLDARRAAFRGPRSRQRFPARARSAEVARLRRRFISSKARAAQRELPLGVVTAIAGSARYSVSIAGLAGHAGTVPMNLRRDAAAAAAEIVLAVERRCSGTAGLVGTVGRLTVPDGAINVIPGRCELSIDLRAGEDSVRDAALNEVLERDREYRRATQGRYRIDEG